ncbi:hypothetical protein WFZ85_15045 [Flavobacterium sp. j3]|uniref:Lipoprotein n=1 Tax=Flavobacterium aureirubrum TaxID=3133147 RepID=A0ABU9N8B3_9FLAO
MRKLIPLFTIFNLVLLSQNCNAQTEEPPKMAMVSDENKPLVDKIIEITNYESYFKNYCEDFIKKTSEQEKWTKEKNESVKAKINFAKFKVLKLYNWLAKYSTKELNGFIESYKKDKKREKKNIIIDDENIAKHLDWYAQGLIKS